MQLYYPKKNNIKAASFSPEKQVALNNFPRFSITFYDDENFIYKRQSFNGFQILSNLISDDHYPEDTNEQNKLNYQKGYADNFKIFYVKIAVYKSIIQDEVGLYSNVFYLEKTQVFGLPSTIYFPVKCYSKEENYTVYETAISVPQSDFISSFDGKNIFNLVGDYDVSLNFPINLSISNSATTSLSQTSSVTIQTLSSSVNNNQYFKIKSAQFLYIEYSDSFDYDFTVANISLAGSLFSTSPTIISSNQPTGISLRFTFEDSYYLNDFQYFGLTIQNDDINFDPISDTLFRIIFITKDNQKIACEACTFLDNNVSGFFNIIFDFTTLPNSTELNYFILEIQSLRSMTNNYNISFMSFLEKNVVSNLSFKTLSSPKITESYTYDIFGNSINIQNLLFGQIIKSSQLFSIAETILILKNEINYEITTHSSKIILPENAFILTDQNFSPVYNITKKTKLVTQNNKEEIISIKIKPKADITLIDTKENSDYLMESFYIKNPTLIKNFERKFIPKQSYDYHNFFYIDSKKYHLMSYDDNFAFSTEVIIIEANKFHEFEIMNKFDKLELLVDSESEILVNNNSKQKFNKGLSVISIDLQESKVFTMKSDSSIRILKIVVSHEL